MAKKAKKNHLENQGSYKPIAAKNFELNSFIKDLREKVADLIYISETDAPIEPVFFVLPDDNSIENFLANESGSTRGSVDIRNAEIFFGRLTSEKEWFREEESKRAKQFAELQKFLEQNLYKIRVYRVGKVKIDIYVLGVFTDSEICGIKTFAVET